MVIGVVSGSVVASHRTANMDGMPLRIVRKVTSDGTITNTYIIAVDSLGSAEGEYVLVANGSTARQTTMTDTKPVDAIIMGIVDMWQIGRTVLYEKATV